MKASELRVNNYYKADLEFPKGSLSAKIGFGNERVFKLDERINQVLWASYSNDMELWRFIKPIPLTEEWLLKFGFKVYNLNRCGEYLKDEIGKYNKDVDYFDYVISSGDDSYGGWNYDTVEIKYVHQLQNLYFALTGEELEIK